MKMRMLGDSGLEVSPLCFGGNVFGWTIDEATSFGLLDAFLEAGFNFVDTADIYSKWKPGNHGGESETIIGNWFKKSGKRNQVILASKVGMELAPDKKGLSKNYIFRAVEDSLKRLQTDYIDLYQSHQDDEATPIEETLEAFAQLQQQGKIRAIGASNFTAARLSEALKTSKDRGLPAYSSLQPLYNLYDREAFENELEKVCVSNGLGVISYFSLASGFLTGKYRSEADLIKSARGQGIKKYLNDRGFRILSALDDVARQHGTTPAKVSLAWLLARPSVTAPIVSATSMEQLNSMIDATTIELEPASIDKLNEASAAIGAKESNASAR